ncbi:MAG TPA: ABC transporter ATP-binding protein [Candidatus Sulfomarinibacteraceae bacterium]|nr:ABC transporter ATP-binding protein [Candidatus Sulfomarinibacteraceae bacterium]
MTAPTARLVVRGLGKRYGELPALDGLDLDVPGSTLLAVIGPNGAGKSTLLGCLSGVLRHGGSATLDGLPISPGDGRTAYLPQRLRLPPTATVADVLGLLRALAGGASDRLPIPDGFVPDGGRRIGELSGGQAQRVALAGALMGTPDLVLLDEPLANLDDDARSVAMALFRAHRDAGAIVLVASPAANDILVAADLAARIENGRLAELGPASACLGSVPATAVRERGA